MTYPTFSIRINPELKKELQEIALLEKISQREIIEKALEMYFSQSLRDRREQKTREKQNSI